MYFLNASECGRSNINFHPRNQDVEEVIKHSTQKQVCSYNLQNLRTVCMSWLFAKLSTTISCQKNSDWNNNLQTFVSNENLPEKLSANGFTPMAPSLLSSLLSSYVPFQKPLSLLSLVYTAQSLRDKELFGKQKHPQQLWLDYKENIRRTKLQRWWSQPIIIARKGRVPKNGEKNYLDLLIRFKNSIKFKGSKHWVRCAFGNV